ncbi:glycoside hydrolase family 79 protein [Pseudocercospora fijiensis CIRAD86]|uniref:Glycoside hydrolase family 79 protein n=1 Tax=Pseudocercospora fijiensis (strain CIRAD86) TaxID=383855 RepID=M2YRJ3_PSEFD|nr:glycoside hydrolase family 79 protein [Pseudocercospora fijiensis CIRAD86]EME80325.1 glycoside hydrolase family 79 protein [Pseudocercospora fijiensis CIRAD86]
MKMPVICKPSVLLGLAASSVTASPVQLSTRQNTDIPLQCSAPDDAGVLLDGFVSFSIEFSSFPDFAGNSSAPNAFSDNLLNNLQDFQGTKPYVRVGGNTQDFAIFNASQEEASIGIVDPDVSADYPSTLTIGPAYFESYTTWPHVRYTHGFNLGKNSSDAREALIDSAPFACQTFQNNDRLLSWELGNEPDLFPGHVRPRDWTESQYVAEWLGYTADIRAAMEKACPELATDAGYKYMAPSFAGTGGNKLDPLRAWNAGLDTDGDISIISSHNYISGAKVPGVTLQGTLMNHTSTITSIAKHINSSNLIHALHPELPYILGETNSLYNQGRPGLSNTFGAALWGIDFNLYCAANNISRVHMHMGTNYRYQSWQPIDTDLASKGTKAPYYGNIGVAAFLGRSEETRVVNLPLAREAEAAYAAYGAQAELKRVMVINMMAYNSTDDNEEFRTDFPRPSEEYRFQIFREEGCEVGVGVEVEVQRLMANGSDAISGITFDGYSYNFELDEGRPVMLGNVTRGETVEVGDDGVVKVDVPWSSAVILRF